MRGRIFVTGIGIVSAIGRNAREALESLWNSRSGIGPITHLDTIHKAELPVGGVRLSNKELAEMIGVAEYQLTTRTTLLGLIAAREAARHAGLDPSDKQLLTGIVSATTVGGMDQTEINFKNYEKGWPYNHFIFTHDCSDSTEKIADDLGIRDYLTTISTACSSSANSVIHGAQLIRHEIVDRVLAGGTDALSRFTLNGFHALLILDKKPCKPFDKDRMGLNLGEGAAYLVLESERSASGKKVLCELKGYGNANDAYHQTGSSPDGLGPYLSMKEALEMSGLGPEAIDYINAHGTGTDDNDLTEGIAIEKIFAPNIPPVSSTKPFTGHTLGAAGAVEAAISIMALTHGMVFPNLNFRTRIPELSFEPVKELAKTNTVRNVMSNSFGFGGNDSTLIFSAC
jgi:3-oxoacyl-(acyl-carrier-protein) synthase